MPLTHRGEVFATLEPGFELLPRNRIARIGLFIREAPIQLGDVLGGNGNGGRIFIDNTVPDLADQYETLLDTEVTVVEGGTTHGRQFDAVRPASQRWPSAATPRHTLQDKLPALVGMRLSQ
jgi:hypothetical protein